MTCYLAVISMLAVGWWLLRDRLVSGLPSRDVWEVLSALRNAL